MQGVFHSNTVDWDLTELGHRQAQRAAPVLVTLPISAVISSPLRRVQQTLDPYLIDKTLNHERDAQLIERDFAGVEGMKIPLDRNFFIEDPEGVEPTKTFITRIVAGLERALVREDMLFGAHAGVMHGLTLGLGIDMDPWAGPYNNATPTVLERHNGRWTLQYWDFEQQTWTTPSPASRDWSLP